LALNKLRVLYLGANKFTEFGFKTFFECLKVKLIQFLNVLIYKFNSKIKDEYLSLLFDTE